MTALRKMDRTMVSALGRSLADAHEGYKQRGYCPMLPRVVADVVEGLRRCAKTPLTTAEMRVLTRVLEADIRAGLSGLTAANTTTMNGGAIWTKWFRAPDAPPPRTNRKDRSILPDLPTLMPQPNDAPIPCLVLNGVITLLYAIAFIVSSPVLLGMHMERRRREVRDGQEYMWGYQAGYNDAVNGNRSKFPRSERRVT